MPRTTRKQRADKSNTSHEKKSFLQQADPLRSNNVTNKRKLKQADYKSFRLAKKIKHAGPKLPSSYSLIKRSFIHIWHYKKIFCIIAITYLILNLLFVRGFIITADIDSVKDIMAEVFSGSTGQIAGSITVMGLLIGSLSPQSEVASLYQSMLFVIFSLFIIWTLRQTYLGASPKARDVFYQSSYPLVQFILITIVIGVQLIPFFLANFLYASIVITGVAVSLIEIFAISILALLLTLWSLYMVSVSVFALYIVALPGMTPVKALRSAKGLVQYRRWTVVRKVILLPVALLLIVLMVFIPMVLIIPSITEVLFLIGSAFMLPLVHSYMYSLYRELLA